MERRNYTDKISYNKSLMCSNTKGVWLMSRPQPTLTYFTGSPTFEILRVPFNEVGGMIRDGREKSPRLNDFNLTAAAVVVKKNSIFIMYVTLTLKVQICLLSLTARDLARNS